MYRIDTTLDLIDTVNALRSRVRPMAVRDMGFLIKTALTVKLSGYSAHDAATLADRLLQAAPLLRRAFGALGGEAVPAFTAGQLLRYRVRLCPTINTRSDPQAKTGERDAFLFARETDAGAVRETVYHGYLDERLRGAAIERSHLERFQIETMVRKHPGTPSGFKSFRMPDAVLVGTLRVTDPELLRESLLAGIGRQRGFGRGFVQVAA
jgi:hypothetical protein